MYVGGKPRSNFVRIAIEQIARTMPDPNTEKGKAYRKGWMDMINEVYSCVGEEMVMVLTILDSSSSHSISARARLGAPYL